jgi:hypothetical protein
MSLYLIRLALLCSPVTTTEVAIYNYTDISALLLITYPGHPHTSSALLPSLRSRLVAMVRQLACNISCFSTNTYSTAEKIVQVPTMAESITEGTLKQFSKREYCF